MLTAEGGRRRAPRTCDLPLPVLHDSPKPAANLQSIFKPQSTIVSSESRHRSYVSTALRPSTGAPVPSGPAAEAAGSPSNETPSFEDFDVMASDLKRVFSVWLRNTRSSFKASHDEIVQDRIRLEEERIKAMHELEDMRKVEAHRLKEQRIRAEQDLAAITKQIATEREAARQKIEADRKKLEVERNNLRLSLRLEEEKLKRDLEALETERRRIVDANIATQTMVEVNVGGVVFETSRQVLVQVQDSYLAALFSGRHEVERDKHGRIFIDRDATLFRQLLNFLREPDSPLLPADETGADLVCREAAYYGIKLLPFPFVLTIGGHDGGEYLRSCEMLDVINQCWRYTAAMETPRAYFAAGSMLNRTYAAGGQNFEYKALCDVEVHEALRDIWLPGPSLLTPRKSVGGAVVDGRFFVAGGFDGTEILSSVECLDPRMRGWMEIPPLTTPRSSAMVVSNNDRELFVMGGSSGERLRTAEVLDMRMEKWTPLNEPMLEIRSGGCAASLLSSIVVMGGIDGGQKVHDTVEMYDNATQRTWAFRKSMPEPRVDGAACVVGSSLIVTGGQAYGEVNSGVHFYRPEMDEWQQAPKLLCARFGHQVIGSLI